MIRLYDIWSCEATAFGRREARFMVNTVLLGSTAMHGGQIDGFESLWEALKPEGAYGNFLSHPTADDLEDPAAFVSRAELGDPIAELEKLAGQKAPQEDSPGRKADDDADEGSDDDPEGPAKSS